MHGYMYFLCLPSLEVKSLKCNSWSKAWKSGTGTVAGVGLWASKGKEKMFQAGGGLPNEGFGPGGVGGG